MAFTLSISTELITVQWHYMDKSHIEFHKNQSRNTWNMDSNSFTPSSDCHRANFH